MLTKKDYCDYETCVALKELGYKIPTSAYYMPNNETLYFVTNPYRGGYVIDCFFSHNSLREDVMTHDFIDAPTMWEAQKWLREEKCIDIQIMISDHNLRWYYVEIYRNGFYKTLKNGYAIKNFITYEEALSEGVRASIKILQDEQKENN